MSNARQRLGKWGEDLAANHLAQRGYTILHRNLRTPYGEVDLIARQETQEGQVLVFVEVKTRSTSSYGYPEEAITAAKQDHLISAAQHFLQENPGLDGNWRVDVIAIRKKGSGKTPEILHFENAIES